MKQTQLKRVQPQAPLSDLAPRSRASRAEQVCVWGPCGWFALLCEDAVVRLLLESAVSPLVSALPAAVEEIEEMNSLFQQKQRELVLAVSRVEELTRQLEMLKNGRIDGHHDGQSAVAELDRLYKELQVTCGCGDAGGVAAPEWGGLLSFLFLQGGGVWDGRPKPRGIPEPLSAAQPGTGSEGHVLEPQPVWVSLRREAGGDLTFCGNYVMASLVIRPW